MTLTRTDAAVPAPASGRPPFAFSVEGPDDWQQLRTDPEHWQGDIDRILRPLDQAPQSSRALTKELRITLEQCVAETQRNGAMLFLLRYGVEDGLWPFVATLSLGMANSAPIPASLDLARAALAGAQALREEAVPLGTCLVVDELDDAPAGILDRFARTGKLGSAQAYLPVGGTTWTAIFTATSSNPSHRELLRALVVRMASTFKVKRSQQEVPHG